MQKFDYHVHSVFSDGDASPREIIETAISLGLTEIGFSEHSYTFFDTEPCIKDFEGYYAEISALEKEYAGKIKVLCGLEQDYFSPAPDSRLDYIIGSVHYVFKDGLYIPVDAGADRLKRDVGIHFGGDFYTLAESYFELVGDLAKKFNPDIIGHFDLITKYNEKYHFFDESCERYRAAWQKSADKLLKTNRVFEINTGAVSRGHKTTPYPSREIYEYIKNRGGRFILSGDSHKANQLCFDFGKYSKYIK
ncbi:MAG: histidinol-phosphatase [Clostridiales bacterium]|nr:histidinol-phosphatase [Candidatus Equinaster intestinalis]